MEIPFQLHDTDSEEEKYEKKREKLSKACGDDPELNRARLLWHVDSLFKRATATEECAQQLLRTLMSGCKYENILEHLSLIKIFPEQFEAKQVRRGCAVLEEKISFLEMTRNEYKKKSSLPLQQEGENEAPKKSVCSPPPGPPLFKMYRKMNQSEILISLASEINQLRKEYDKMHGHHHMLQEGFSAVKGEKAWNLLCKCVKEVDHMRNVLDAMTDGQFEKGIIEYVNPRRVDALELKLIKTDNNLQRMEIALDRLKNFRTETEAILAKCTPILEQLYITEQKEDTYAEDLKNALAISERIGVMEVDVEHMSNLITALMLRLEGRMALIEATVKNMKLLDEAKADKDYVEDSLPLMAEKDKVKKTVTYEVMANAFNEIAQRIMDCFGRIMKTMNEWNEKLEEFQLDTAHKINKSEFSQLLDILDTKLSSYYTEVKDLEIGHIEERGERSREEEHFKNLRCITCDEDAKMIATRDCGVPILPPCKPRLNVGARTAYEFYKCQYWRENQHAEIQLSDFKCPQDIVCQVGGKKTDRFCARFGSDACQESRVCVHTPPDDQESVLKVVELGDFSSRVSAPKHKNNNNKTKEDKEASSENKDKPKKVSRVIRLSSENVKN